MGLESTEFVIAVEKALGLSIPDSDFRGMRTPRGQARLEGRG